MELLCDEFYCSGRYRFFPVKGRISIVVLRAPDEGEEYRRWIIEL